MSNDLALLLLSWTQGYMIASAAALVPGPDLLLVVRTSLSAGRKAGLLCTAGIGCGLTLYSVATLVAAESLAAAPSWCYTALRVVGATYIAWIGLAMIRSAGTSIAVDDANGQTLAPVGRGYLALGATTALTNPKLLFFLFAVVAQVVGGRDHLDGRVAILAGVVAGPMTVFSAVAIMCGVMHRRLRTGHVRAVDRLSGSLLIAFAVLGLLLAR